MKEELVKTFCTSPHEGIYSCYTGELLGENHQNWYLLGLYRICVNLVNIDPKG